ncbi:hypothetical protein EDD21DRAFT_353899 [Dissophora ornata]|nr:hypothetical protein BGZ58_006526 [Dissophora ornata]KAI8601183.1 hypothetical protein EDD21DRAFT_353899 [Dissophora ornata]
MTRTRTGDYKGLAAAQRDRHQSRNGADPRAIPKKAGAGNGNWGVPGCELDQQEQTSALSNMATSPPENKITVIDAEAFSRLQNSGSAQSMANDEQRDADENATSSTSASS